MTEVTTEDKVTPEAEAPAPVTPPTQTITEAEEVELQGRISAFNAELKPLLGKYELGLSAMAFVRPEGTLGAQPVVVDARPKPETVTPAGTVATPAVEKPADTLVNPDA